MSVVTLIRAWPRIASSGAVSLVMLAGGSGNAPYPAGYFAGIIAEPRFQSSVSFGDDGWAARAIPAVGALAWSPAEAHRLDGLATLYWRDAAIEVDRVVDGVSQRRLTGTVADATISEGKLVLTCADLAKALDKAIAPTTFAGNGDIEGGDYATGRVKRRSFGQVWNVEGRLLAQAYNIYEFGDPAIPLQGCSALRDKGRAGPLAILAWQGSMDATFAALKAAEAPRGGGVFAPSIACAKWWTQPSGPLTADLLGQADNYADSVVGIANQLLTLGGGPAILGLAETIALRPGKAGLHIADGSETTAGALDRLLQRVTLGWSIEPAGGVRIWPWTFSSPIAAMQATFISRESTVRPVVQRTVGYRKNERIHSDGELSAILQAGDIIYDSGVPVADKEPAEAGADKTSNHVAADTAAVAGRAAAELIAQSDINTDGLLSEALRQDQLEQIFDARTLVEGQPVGTKFLQFRNEQVDANSALAALLTLIGATSADGTAWNLNMDTVRVGPGKSFAQHLQEVGLTTEQVQASVQFLMEVMTGPDGSEARAVLKTDLNGNLASVVLASGEEISRIGLIAGQTVVAKPDGTVLASFGVDGDMAYIPNLKVDHVSAGSVTIEGMALGFSDVLSFTGTDTTVDGTEATIIETPYFWLGDDESGRGLATISYLHDSSTVIDTAWRVRVYIDTGGGYGSAVRDNQQAIRTSSGNTKWVLPISFPVLLSATTAVRIKVTAVSIAFGGTGAINGASARNSRVDILKLGR